MNNSRCDSCGFISFASAKTCKKCGKAITSSAENARPFAGKDVFRDDDKLIVMRGAELPDRCIVCNSPARGRRYPLKLSWGHKLHKAPLVVGTAKISYQETEMPVGFCRTHFLRQAYSFFAGIFLFLFGLALTFFSMTRENTWILLVGMGIGVVIAGAGGYVQQFAPVKVERSDESKLWLKGVCASYLMRLPKWQS